MSHNTDQDPNGLKDDALAGSSTPESIADGVDEEVVEPNRRLFVGWQFLLFAALAIAYSGVGRRYDCAFVLCIHCGAFSGESAQRST